MNNNRILWLDAIRLIAIFMLICCHSADMFNFFPGTPPPDIDSYRFWGGALGSLMRPCVPLFAMLTGALLLPTADTFSTIVRHRIGRVLWPFLLWSVFYALIPWLLGCMGFAPETILNIFAYNDEDCLNQSLTMSTHNIMGIALNFNTIAVHMWYIYMLIGLYLYLPVFSAWVRQASVGAKRTFLALWGVTLVIPYLHRFVAPYLWGECDWNSFGMLYYFAGFNGYLLLGHYIRHHLPSPRRALPLAAVMFVVGYAIIFTGFTSMQRTPSPTSLDLELFWLYCSPQVVLTTAAIFLAVASMAPHLDAARHPRLATWGARLTRCGFGIYMVHYMMTGPGVLVMRHIGVPVGLQIPCGSLVVFAISWALTALVLRVLGRAGRYVMG